MTSPSELRIIAAAVRVGRSIVSVPKPGRHCDLMQGAEWHGRSVGLIPPDDQGFLASDGRFYGRVPACAIARDAGQIVKKHGPPDELFSEDLWP